MIALLACYSALQMHWKQKATSFVFASCPTDEVVFEWWILIHPFLLCGGCWLISAVLGFFFTALLLSVLLFSFAELFFVCSQYTSGSFPFQGIPYCCIGYVQCLWNVLEALGCQNGLFISHRQLRFSCFTGNTYDLSQE